MTEIQIALKERINELRAKQIKFGKWEREKSFEIRQLIREQSHLEDDIIALECELAKTKETIQQQESDRMWRIKKLLGGYIR